MKSEEIESTAEVGITSKALDDVVEPSQGQIKGMQYPGRPAINVKPPGVV